MHTLVVIKHECLTRLEDQISQLKNALECNSQVQVPHKTSQAILLANTCNCQVKIELYNMPFTVE